MRTTLVSHLRRHRARRRSTFFTVIELGGAFAGFLFFVCTGIVLIWFATLNVPSIEGFHNRRVPESTKIYDRTGKVLLYDVHGTIRRTSIPLDQVSPNIQNATIAIEDPEFYSHFGIKPRAILRAIFSDLSTGSFGQGGSTLTQQVVKNTLLTSEKTITRKVKEWILAIKLERMYTKAQILEIYFNETPYGGTMYGVEEATEAFYNKPASDVDVAEAAYVAALTQAPTYYSPYGNHRDELDDRKNLVLSKMKEYGYITDAQYQAAKKEVVTFQDPANTGIKAPHFVFYVREYLEQKYGVQAVSEGGLKVITTLDYDMQQRAEDIVKRYALSNAKSFNASNADLVALDPKTGQVLAMVGSRDYFDKAIDGKFNVALAHRQPGSSFKPFVYATAFAKGYTPDTVLFDLKTQFSASCDPNFFETTDTCYSPDNYDHVFRGPMSLRDALAQSVNVPAVKVLYLAGIKESLDTAERMGITSLTNPTQYGSSLVLGGGEVSMLEMVSAYGAFANDGVHKPSTGILSVTDPSGKELESYTDTPGVQAISSDIAHTISDVLSDNEARAPAFGENSALLVPGHSVAVKTGTTNDYRDAWVIGYTPSLVVGSWAGNNDNTPMEKKVAGFIVAPMWNEFMVKTLATSTNETFPPPPTIDPSLPPPLRGIWNQSGQVHEILYWIDKSNPLGPPPTNPENDPQFKLWEYPVGIWTQQGIGFFNALSSTTTSPNVLSSQPVPFIPTGTVGNSPEPSVDSYFHITSPADGSTVPANTLLTIQVAGSVLETTQSVSYYLNGVSVGTSNKAPFSLSIIPSELGIIVIRAVAQTNSGGFSSQISTTVR